MRLLITEIEQPQSTIKDNLNKIMQEGFRPAGRNEAVQPALFGGIQINRFIYSGTTGLQPSLSFPSSSNPMAFIAFKSPGSPLPARLQARSNLRSGVFV